MKTFNIIHGIITLALSVVLIWSILPNKTLETPVVSPIEQNEVDVKIAHAVDSVLKAVSKTDNQILDLYIEQEKIIVNLGKQINGFEIELRNLRNAL
jgi:hypothetical protein